jgi:hypothetical protein
MKIFRRKKNGREVGTYYVRMRNGGRPVSLSLDGVPCTDAKEANRRARLALKGQWPPAASKAAKVASRAEHVPEDEPLKPETPEENGGVAAGHVPSPSAAPVPEPSPEPSPGAADTGDEPDPVAAASAAAADAAGPAEAGEIPPDEESRRQQWGQAFAEKFGAIGFATGDSVTPGMVVAMGHLGAVSRVYAALGAKRRPPQYLQMKTESIAVPMQMLAMAWDEQLRRWGLDLSKVQPWMAMIGGTIGLMVACSMSMTTQPQGEGAQPGGGQQ